MHGCRAWVEAQELAHSRLVGLVVVGKFLGVVPRGCGCLAVDQVDWESVRVGQGHHVAASGGVCELCYPGGCW